MTSASTAWFTHDRLGMFMHFGLYSIPARGEWLKERERLTDDQYQTYFDRFDPDLLDAREWAATAREMGADYVVLTTKHHDGFCLWDSQLTDYTAAKACGRDIVREYVEALHEAGLKVGFYHSVVDWHHPDYSVDFCHPRRDDDELDVLNADRDMDVYREYLHGQVRELLTGYGQVDLLFFDFTHTEGEHGLPGKTAEDWDAERLMAMARELQPGIMINNRLGIPGDYETPESVQPTRPLLRDGVPVVWEACHVLGDGWGYIRDIDEAKDPDLLVRMLIQTVSADGNLLLNIGPNGRGLITPRHKAIAGELGNWVHLHERAIRGAGYAADFSPPPACLYTQRGNRLYVHVLAWPLDLLDLPDLAGRVEWAQLLNDGSDLPIVGYAPPAAGQLALPPPAGTLTLRLPRKRPDVLVPVIELQLKG